MFTFHTPQQTPTPASCLVQIAFVVVFLICPTMALVFSTPQPMDSPTLVSGGLVSLTWISDSSDPTQFDIDIFNTASHEACLVVSQINTENRRMLINLPHVYDRSEAAFLLRAIDASDKSKFFGVSPPFEIEPSIYTTIVTSFQSPSASPVPDHISVANGPHTGKAAPHIGPIIGGVLGALALGSIVALYALLRRRRRAQASQFTIESLPLPLPPTSGTQPPSLSLFTDTPTTGLSEKRRMRNRAQPLQGNDHPPLPLHSTPSSTVSGETMLRAELEMMRERIRTLEAQREREAVGADVVLGGAYESDACESPPDYATASGHA